MVVAKTGNQTGNHVLVARLSTLVVRRYGRTLLCFSRAGRDRQGWHSVDSRCEIEQVRVCVPAQCQFNRRMSGQSLHCLR
ncbi:MAG: hypothetical protein CMJ69_09590 [Planctomycetaceae bacterium]|nr:hypothetical protein [Planctomycetaceae bacterium]